MQQLPNLFREHFATGYASDDEVAPGPRRRSARNYGALPGDEPPRPRLSHEEVLEYGVRQNAAGPKRRKVRFLDALLAAPGARLSAAQLRPRGSLQEHRALLHCLPRGATVPLAAKAEAPKSDFQLLCERHRFLWAAEDDDGSWEARLAQRYYQRLFREYVICDLAGYKTGHVGFRWRTEAEVLRGKGQFQCGHRRCDCVVQLKSYEVDFKYREAGQKKRALVKARLCEDCAYKLHYRRLKAERKRRRAEWEMSARKRTKVENTGTVVVDDGSRSAHGDADSSQGDDQLAVAAGGMDAPVGAEAEADRRVLEALAWCGPDPELRTCGDDMDEYLRELFL